MRSAVLFERNAFLLKPFMPVFAYIVFALRIRIIGPFVLRMYPLPVMLSVLLNLAGWNTVFCKNLCSDSSNANSIV